jgi:hypothetical protein
MMKTTVNLYDFQRAFVELRPDNFTNEALELLFEYFEDAMGDDFEFDVIGICCEFYEDTIEDVIAAYSYKVDTNNDDIKGQVLDFLADKGALVGETSKGAVYRAF